MQDGDTDTSLLLYSQVNRAPPQNADRKMPKRRERHSGAVAKDFLFFMSKRWSQHNDSEGMEGKKVELLRSFFRDEKGLSAVSITLLSFR